MQPQKQYQPQYGKTHLFRTYYAKAGSPRPSTSAGLALQCVSQPDSLQTFSRLPNNVCLALLLLTQIGVIRDHYLSLATDTLFAGAGDQAMVSSLLLQQRAYPRMLCLALARSLVKCMESCKLFADPPCSFGRG